MLDIGSKKNQGGSSGLSSRPPQISPKIRRNQGISHNELKRSSSPPSKLRGMSPDAAEKWSNPSNNQKPPSKLRGMSPDAAEKWSNPSNNQKPPSKLRGMSPDAAEKWSNPSNSYGTYNIRSGDTLSAIAQRELGSSSRWREIKKVDGSSFSASEAGRLQVGQQISLPGTSISTNKPSRGETPKLHGMSPDAAEKWSNPTNSYGTYNIRSGDTLSAIAQRELGSSSRWREIKKVDGSSFSASEAGRLQVGQQISLPGTSSSTNKPSRGETPKLHGMSPDAAEKWSNPTNNQKPLSKLRGMSPNAAERWSNSAENREATPVSNRQPTSTFQPFTFQQDVGRGIINGAWDAVQGAGDLARGLYNLSLNPNREVREQTAQSVGEGVQSLAQNPAVQSLANPILAGLNFTSRPRETRQAFQDLGTGIAQPYVDAWRSGRPGEAVGRVAFDVGSMLVPGGAIIKSGRATTVTSTLGTAANVADEAGDVARVTGRIAGAEQAINPQNAALAARNRSQLAKEEIENAPAIGSALKPDSQHRSASFVVDRAGEGQHFTIKNRDGTHVNLTQVEGSMNGKEGIFEWIVDKGRLTHQRFIPEGRITGFPNQNPKKLPN